MNRKDVWGLDWDTEVPEHSTTSTMGDTGTGGQSGGYSSDYSGSSGQVESNFSDYSAPTYDDAWTDAKVKDAASKAIADLFGIEISATDLKGKSLAEMIGDFNNKPGSINVEVAPDSGYIESYGQNLANGPFGEVAISKAYHDSLPGPFGVDSLGKANQLTANAYQASGQQIADALRTVLETIDDTLGAFNQALRTNAKSEETMRMKAADIFQNVYGTYGQNLVTNAQNQQMMAIKTADTLKD